jgi:hypothetical protein
MSPRCSPQLNAFCAGPALDGESPIRYFLSDRLLNCVDFLGARLASTFTPVAKTFRPCFHEPAPPGPRRPAPSRVTLKSKKSCSLAEKQPFRGDVRCLTMVPPCRGQFETGSRRATFVRRPQWLVLLLERRQEPVPRSPGAIAGSYVLSGLLPFRQPAFENLSGNKLATSRKRLGQEEAGTDGTVRAAQQTRLGTVSSVPLTRVSIGL